MNSDLYTRLILTALTIGVFMLVYQGMSGEQPLQSKAWKCESSLNFGAAMMGGLTFDKSMKAFINEVDSAERGTQSPAMKTFQDLLNKEKASQIVSVGDSVCYR